MNRMKLKAARFAAKGIFGGFTLAVFALCLFVSPLAVGQAAPTEVTNSDVISMTKAGIGEQTIILAIQHGPDKFDTSPQALIALKASGVSDQVLNAILATGNTKGVTSAGGQSNDGEVLFQKALDAIGPHDKIMAVHSFQLKADVTASGQGKTISFVREEVRVFPDKDFTASIPATGPSQKQIITVEFSYRTSGSSTTSIPADDLAAAREGLEFAPLYVAQHPGDYVISSMGEQPNIGKLKISKSGQASVWEIDLQTGRLLSSERETPKGSVVAHYSDYRLVQGLNVPFKVQSNERGHDVDFTVREYEINPTIDESLFKRPAENATGNTSQGLTLRVLQEQSVPYTQESGGGISASCNIVGTANTSAYATAYGNSAYGNATTNSNQHMSCNSYDTTIRWPHVLNVMFAQASDGNSYIIACDRAWRWSKCNPLRAGEVFSARFTGAGIEVQAVNSKGKEESITYKVLQSRAWR
jgi:hypothetical protein